MAETDDKPIQQTENSSGFQSGTIVIGQLIGLDEQGRPLVDFNENPGKSPLPALTTQSLTKLHISRQVALLFDEGNLTKPVIMGLIHNPLEELLENFELIAASTTEEKTAAHSASDDSEVLLEDVNVDGNRVVIEAQQEIVLKCGEASITLTRAGKILIRGKYLLNRSSGVNRIMGGSVQVN